jgi:hypothetical protein
MSAAPTPSMLSSPYGARESSKRSFGSWFDRSNVTAQSGWSRPVAKNQSIVTAYVVGSFAPAALQRRGYACVKRKIAWCRPVASRWNAPGVP